MRAILLTLLLASCSSFPVMPDFDRVGQLYRTDGGYGTAIPVAYAGDGFYVLTCQHVVRGYGEGFVLHLDGMSYYGGVVTWVDKRTDTALVGFTTEDRPKVYEFALQPPRRYSRGYAAGYPLGVSALVVGDVLFQGGLMINHLTGPGGSGGPVFSEDGLVVGIVAGGKMPNTRPQRGIAAFGWITQMSDLSEATKKIAELRAQ